MTKAINIEVFSYNTVLASTKIKSIKLQNVSNTYSSFNSKKFDISDTHKKYLLYSQFLAWYWKGQSIAPLLDFTHNQVYQELPKLNDYFTTAQEKIFIDFRRRKAYTNEIEKRNRNDSDS